MGQSVIHGHNINLIYGPIRTLRIGRAAVYVGWPGFAGTLSAPMRQVWLVRYIRVRVTDSCRMLQPIPIPSQPFKVVSMNFMNKIARITDEAVMDL